jgi:hypothetical protein
MTAWPCGKKSLKKRFQKSRNSLKFFFKKIVTLRQNPSHPLNGPIFVSQNLGAKAPTTNLGAKAPTTNLIDVQDLY